MNPALRHAAKEYLVRYGGDAFPNLFVSAKGTIVSDDTGREILDFTSGQMCATIGHNHPAIVEAVHAAGTKAFHLFSGMIPEVVAELAQTLARDWMPRRPDQVAVRQHRRREQRGGAAHGQDAHRRLRGAGGRRLLARRHRRHQRGLLRQRPQGLRRARARRLRDAGAERLPALHRGRRPEEESALACLELGLKMFDMQSIGRPAAIIIEPIISAGGVLVPPKAYMQALRQAADERGMLLIFDEAQTAFGRIGHKTGSEFFGVDPRHHERVEDAGRRPAAGRRRSPPPAIEDSVHGKGFTFYTSHVSDPLPAEVGLAVLRVIAEEHLVERARTIGGYLRGRLEELQQRYEAIGDVRGEGLLLGVELVQDRESRKPNHELGGAPPRNASSWA